MGDIVWRFKTKNFEVRLVCERDWHYRYDGDDPDGDTQRLIDTGEMIAFDSVVEVRYHGELVGDAHLGGSVYYEHTASEFWTGHRAPDPKNRNCAANSYRVAHYFPPMVSEAIAHARSYFADMPKLRARA